MTALKRVRALLSRRSLDAASSAPTPTDAATLTILDTGFPPSDRQQPVAGTRRWGELLLLERVGEGGFAEVFRAWDPTLEREVALKLFRQDDSGHTKPSRALLREGRLLARIRHPNVVTVYGVSEQDGTVGLWMEFVRGRTLDRLILDDGLLGWGQAAQLGIDLCQALSDLHDQKVVHGDIKAKNVMREDSGRVVLMDFGLGRDLRAGSDSAAYIGGTPPYMAPELLRGEDATIPSDVYALGVLLYHLVSGSYPATGRSLAELLEAHREGKVKALRDVRPDLPENFLEVVDRACSTDPAQRFSSAAELEQALQSLVKPPPVPSGLRRRLILLAGTAALALFGGYLVYPKSPAEPLPVLVADFVNRTNEPSMDLTARELLIVALEQSRWFQVIPRSQAQETMALMRLPGTAPLDLATATQICRREAYPILVSGTVTPAAAGFDIQVRAIDPQTGETRALVTQTAARKQELPASIDRLAGDLRRELGENWLAIARDSTPSERVTTSSFEALERFSRAIDSRNQASMEDALRWLESAVEKDPEFAMAHRQLAITSASLGRFPMSMKAALRAYELRGRTSERERHLIEAHYYTQVGDFVSVMERNRTVTILYPGDAAAHSHLAQYQAFLGQMDAAVDTMKRAADLRPNSVHSRGLLAVLLAEANREDEALEVIRVAREKQLPGSYLYWGEGLAWLGKGDTARARRAFQSLAQAGGVYEGWGMLYEAQTLILEGKLDAAASLLEASEAVHLSTTNMDTEMRSREWRARIYLLRNERSRAMTQLGLLHMPDASPAQQVLKTLRKPALLYTELRAPSLAEPIAAKLEQISRQYPNLMTAGVAAHVQGDLDRSASRWDAAYTNLERARARWGDVLTQWSLAEYHDTRQQCDRALPIYREILARKGAVLRSEFSGIWILSHLRAARCLRKLGKLQDAAVSYDKFLHYWGNS